MHARRRELDAFYRDMELAALEAQNHPLPNGYVYIPIGRQSCSESAGEPIHLRRTAAGIERVSLPRPRPLEQRAGYNPPATPDAMFPSHMRYDKPVYQPSWAVFVSMLAGFLFWCVVVWKVGRMFHH